MFIIKSFDFDFISQWHASTRNLIPNQSKVLFELWSCSNLTRILHYLLFLIADYAPPFQRSWSDSLQQFHLKVRFHQCFFSISHFSSLIVAFFFDHYFLSQTRRSPRRLVLWRLLCSAQHIHPHLSALLPAIIFSSLTDQLLTVSYCKIYVSLLFRLVSSST